MPSIRPTLARSDRAVAPGCATQVLTRRTSASATARGTSNGAYTVVDTPSVWRIDVGAGLTGSTRHLASLPVEGSLGPDAIARLREAAHSLNTSKSDGDAPEAPWTTDPG